MLEWAELCFNEGQRLTALLLQFEVSSKLLLWNWSYNYIMDTQNTNLQVWFSLTIKMWFSLFIISSSKDILVPVNTFTVWLQLTELYCPFYWTPA